LTGWKCAGIVQGSFGARAGVKALRRNDLLKEFAWPKANNTLMDPPIETPRQGGLKFTLVALGRCVPPGQRLLQQLGRGSRARRARRYLGLGQAALVAFERSQPARPPTPPTRRGGSGAALLERRKQRRPPRPSPQAVPSVSSPQWSATTRGSGRVRRTATRQAGRSPWNQCATRSPTSCRARRVRDRRLQGVDVCRRLVDAGVTCAV